MIRYIKQVKRPPRLAGGIGDIKDVPLQDAQTLVRDGYAVFHVEAQPVPQPAAPVVVTPPADDFYFGDEDNG